MPYSIFCSTADNSRTSQFWVASRDRIPTREEAEAIRLLLVTFFWSTTARMYEMPKGMTVDTLESSLQSVTGLSFKLAYSANKTLFML